MIEDVDNKDFPWEELYDVKNYLFNTQMSYKEISEALGKSESFVKDIVDKQNLSWTRKKDRRLSKGASLLTSLFRELIPGERIINEFHVGERLMLDVYCPSYKLGAEYHGIQHFKYNSMFHTFKSDFTAGQYRDIRKLELCEESGITVVVFKYDDDLSEDMVSDRIISGLLADTSDKHDILPVNKVLSEYEKDIKSRRKDFYKKQYKKAKEYRDRDNNRQF